MNYGLGTVSLGFRAAIFVVLSVLCVPCVATDEFPGKSFVWLVQSDSELVSINVSKSYFSGDAGLREAGSISIVRADYVATYISDIDLPESLDWYVAVPVSPDSEQVIRNFVLLASRLVDLVSPDTVRIDIPGDYANSAVVTIR